MLFRSNLTKLFAVLGVTMIASVSHADNSASYLGQNGEIDPALVEERANEAALSVLEIWLANSANKEIQVTVAITEE